VTNKWQHKLAESKVMIVMAGVRIRGLHKTYNRTEAVCGIDLDIADGEFVVLVGPSGCGKSSTLRMIAGLEEITKGEIFIDDRLVNHVQPKDRDIAMVFQNYALYPHMTARENMSFGLRMRRYAKDEIKTRVTEAARFLNIAELLDRRPGQLSGGERQRVAMGRAIVREPSVCLFDEPLSNLDAKLRVKMRTEIKRLHHKVKTTSLYVTHDQVEAMTLAERIVIMNAGRIEQVGTPDEIYLHPKTKFVAGFIGSPAMNFLHCRLAKEGGGLTISLTGGGPSLPVPTVRTGRYSPHLGKDLVFGIRPEHITQRPDHGGAKADFVEIDIKIDVVEPLGMDTLLYFSIGDTEVCARVSPDVAREPGEIMLLKAEMNQMHLIDPDTGTVL